MSNQIKRTSKFMSFVLRHDPGRIDLKLDLEGWAKVDDLLDKMNKNGVRIDLPLLQRVVEENDKKRFAFSDDGQSIRANQGHSINIDLALEPTVPPAKLYHGTATRFVDGIRKDGLVKMSRQHIHLSPDLETATRVGQRHGKPFILHIEALAMHEQGHQFFISENGVWLTDVVPANYISNFCDEQT